MTGRTNWLSPKSGRYCIRNFEWSIKIQDDSGSVAQARKSHAYGEHPISNSCFTSSKSSTMHKYYSALVISHPWVSNESRTSSAPARPRGCAASRYSRRFAFRSEYRYNIRFHYSICTRTAVYILYKLQNCRLSNHADGGNHVLFLYCNMHQNATVPITVTVLYASAEKPIRTSSIFFYLAPTINQGMRRKNSPWSSQSGCEPVSLLDGNAARMIT